MRSEVALIFRGVVRNIAACVVVVVTLLLPAPTQAEQGRSANQGQQTTQSSNIQPSQPAIQSKRASQTPQTVSTDPKSSAAPSPSDTSMATAKRPSRPGERPLPSLLGMTLESVTADFGAPAQVFTVRGQKAWEDDVVFYYSDHSYLFWFRNRVWQVRVDRRFSGTVLGVKMGEGRATVEDVLGTPFHTAPHSEIFLLPYRGFPVRARLFFTDGRLSDLYVYRGDF